MKTADLTLPDLNRRLTRRLLGCWIAYIAVFFLCKVFEDLALSIALHVAQYAPSVEKQLQRDSLFGKTTASYFAALMVISPIATLYLTTGENFLLRFRQNVKRLQAGGKSKFESVFVGYVFGAPVSIFVLYVLIASPFSDNGSPRLAGQHVAHLLTETELGLLVFGSAAALGATVMLLALSALFMVPLLAIVDGKHTSKPRRNHV